MVFVTFSACSYAILDNVYTLKIVVGRVTYKRGVDGDRRELYAGAAGRVFGRRRYGSRSQRLRRNTDACVRGRGRRRRRCVAETRVDVLRPVAVHGVEMLERSRRVQLDIRVRIYLQHSTHTWN